MKKALLASFLCAIVLACPPYDSPSAPDDPPTSDKGITFSINSGASTTLAHGIPLSSPNITVTTANVPFGSIPSGDAYLRLYASSEDLDFEALGQDYIEIYITVAGSSIAAGTWSSAANVWVQIGGAKYMAAGPSFAIDLVLDQTVDSSTSIGQTVTGSFSGNVTADGGTTIVTLSGTFKLVYQGSTWTGT